MVAFLLITSTLRELVHFTFCALATAALERQFQPILTNSSYLFIYLFIYLLLLYGKYAKGLQATGACSLKTQVIHTL